jgi:uncharacterized surface protein with fasciclin (FAS1) repeats
LRELTYPANIKNSRTNFNTLNSTKIRRKIKMYQKIKKSLTVIIALALMTVVATAAFAAPAAQGEKTIVDIAVEDGRFTTLVTALQAAELVETLQGEGPFTVFAPTDDAFAALPEGTLDALLADKAALTDVLLYHVVLGKVMAADVVNLTSADTVLGQPASISFDGETVKVDDANVIITDIEGSNGVIHVIDAVIIPSAEKAMNDSMMDGSMTVCSQDYVVQADDWLSKVAEKFYGDPLAYSLIFDATNAAAAKGGYDAIADADFIEVGQVLCIPTGPEGEQEAMMSADTIVDIAVNDGRFTTLVTALQAASLVETLQGEGPFTVFAPTDDAFAKLPEGTLDSLLEDIPALTNVLLYHVVPGKVMAADVVMLDAADTVLGEPVAISADDSGIMVNDAQVIITDIEGSNGVIHVIDTVILPPSGQEEAMMAKDIVDTAVADGRFTTLATALEAAGLIDTLKGEGPFTVFAPTDDAFAKLPEGTVAGLLEDIPTLTNILLYHVVAGKVPAADVVNLSSADTVLGQPVSISVNGDTVNVGDAQVVITDIETSNGIIHVIDTVLIPESQ